MKKIFIFVLILCTFFSTLVFTLPKVNAAENNYSTLVDLTGATINVPSGWICSADYGDFSITADSIKINNNGYGSGINLTGFYIGDLSRANYIQIMRKVDSVKTEGFDTTSGAIVINNITGGRDVTNQSLIQWFISNNATVTGGVYELNDNLDLPDFIPNSSYVNEFPYFTLVGISENNFSTTSFRIYMTTEPLKYNLSSNSYILGSNESVKRYNLENNLWVEGNTTNNGLTLSNDNSTRIIDTNYDIYDTSNNLYLPGYQSFFLLPPLHQVVGEVGATSVKSQWSQIVGGTIPILIACGVGCLALLIVLKLFGKKSLIFRR